MKPNIDNLVNHADYSEKVLERYLVKRVKEKGGLCLKYSNPTEVGYPDRLVITQYGRNFFVELKSKGCKPRPIQCKRIEELRKRNVEVFVCDSRESIENEVMPLMELEPFDLSDIFPEEPYDL